MLRLSVSALTTTISQLLEGELGDVCVEGEISGYKVHSSGHWYFSLKDEGAVVSCAMFRGDNQRMRRQPREGERVLLYGGLSVYPPRGSYSLIVRKIEAVGVGELQRRLAELRARLGAEGLFAAERKRPLPTFPEAIGLATSPTGAALQDLLRVIHGRFPGMPIYLAACKVQGEGAAADIARAVDLLNAHGKSSVIIVGRGGGSVEDLWAFNEEVVVRAVARSAIPTVSAVGHEVDFTLCDLAADVRAATPSHAGELVTPVRDELALTVDGFEVRLVAALQRRITTLRQLVVRTRLLHPRQVVERSRLRCDELDDRLRHAMGRRLVAARERVERLRLQPPRTSVHQAAVVRFEARLAPAVLRLAAVRRERLRSAMAQLQALSPLAVLDRGYAIAKKGDHVLRSVAEVSPGDPIEVRLPDGVIAAEVRAAR